MIREDDFGGDAGSPPNPAIWSYDTGGGGWGNQEWQTYTDEPDNVALDGLGHLVITARADALPDGTPTYTSARITTRGSAGVGYGTVSARIKLPSGVGLLPAFWLLGSDLAQVGYPAAGEIDVVETPGAGSRSFHTLHGPDADGSTWSVSSGRLNSPPLSQGFHVYSVTRTPDSVEEAIDGRSVLDVRRDQLAPGQLWPFTGSFDVLLSLAVGGSWTGVPDATTRFPAQLIVDWVRYQP